MLLPTPPTHTLFSFSHNFFFSFFGDVTRTQEVMYLRHGLFTAKLYARSGSGVLSSFFHSIALVDDPTRQPVYNVCVMCGSLSLSRAHEGGVSVLGSAQLSLDPVPFQQFRSSRFLVKRTDELCSGILEHSRRSGKF